jgi:hypothetical protein
VAWARAAVAEAAIARKVPRRDGYLPKIFIAGLRIA